MNREKFKKENTMPNRKRPIIMRLAVTEDEKNLIEEKMKILGTRKCRRSQQDWRKYQSNLQEDK